MQRYLKNELLRTTASVQYVLVALKWLWLLFCVKPVNHFTTTVKLLLCFAEYIEMARAKQLFFTDALFTKCSRKIVTEKRKPWLQTEACQHSS